MDMSLMKQLYIALVRPHLEYGNVVWHPDLKKGIRLLESVQQRATKLIPELCNMCYENRLKSLDLPSLSYRRLRGDPIKTFKYLHDIYTVDSSLLIPLSQPTGGVVTRGHSFKLRKRDSKISVRAKCSWISCCETA